MKKIDSSENENTSFEHSYKRLEKILHKLENEVEDSSLDEIIKCYQEGVELLKICRDKLKDAELKIQKISE